MAIRFTFILSAILILLMDYLPQKAHDEWITTFALLIIMYIKGVIHTRSNKKIKIKLESLTQFSICFIPLISTNNLFAQSVGITLCSITLIYAGTLFFQKRRAQHEKNYIRQKCLNVASVLLLVIIASITSIPLAHTLIALASIATLDILFTKKYIWDDFYTIP